MSAISGIRISACRPCRDGLGDGLEIDLGLARAGDAFEERHRRAARPHEVDEDLRRGRLRGRKRGPGVVGIRRFGDRFGGQSHAFEGALVDEAVDDAGAHPGRLGEVALEVDEAALGRFQHAGAGGGQAQRRRPGEADADARDLGPALVGQLQAEGEGRALRGEGVPGDPVEELAHRRGDGRRREAQAHRLEIRPGPRPQAPDDADGLPRPERHLHDVAFRKDEAVGNGVGIGRVEGEGNQDVGDAR